ncbi:hypothetical protein Tco_0456127 [Tanacetum coccineum]
MRRRFHSQVANREIDRGNVDPSKRKGRKLFINEITKEELNDNTPELLNSKLHRSAIFGRQKAVNFQTCRLRSYCSTPLKDDEKNDL